MSLIQRIKSLNEYLRLGGAAWRDLRRYCRYACIGWNRNEYDDGQLEGRIIAYYHVIEKGLSMPDFRPCFGVPMVKKLIALTSEGADRFSWGCNVNYLTAVRVVQAYMQKHKELGIDLTDSFSEEEMEYGADILGGECVEAGSKAHSSETYFSKAQSSFFEFARTRHSCRVYETDVPVDKLKILAAIEVARFTPSVCNRQCWRVHIYQDKTKVDELLSFQGGNRGFGHTIPTLLVITSRLNVFDGYQERNQAFIDGGLFSMSLMYGLHNQELGCVPLCWLASPSVDDGMRQAGSIPDNETIVMMMGVGVPVANFMAPASQRRDVEEIVKIH